MRCSTCGASGSGRFCSSCGGALSAPSGCAACGQALSPADTFCGSCGHRVEGQQVSRGAVHASPPPRTAPQPMPRHQSPAPVRHVQPAIGATRSWTVVVTLIAAILHILGSLVIALEFALWIVNTGDDGTRIMLGVMAGLLVLGALFSLICAIGIMSGSRFAWVCGILACVFGIVAALPTIILFVFLLVPPTRAWVRARSG